jgi:hypothetical protein
MSVTAVKMSLFASTTEEAADPITLTIFGSPRIFPCYKIRSVFELIQASCLFYQLTHGVQVVSEVQMVSKEAAFNAVNELTNAIQKFENDKPGYQAQKLAAQSVVNAFNTKFKIPTSVYSQRELDRIMNNIENLKKAAGGSKNKTTPEGLNTFQSQNDRQRQKIQNTIDAITAIVGTVDSTLEKAINSARTGADPKTELHQILLRVQAASKKKTKPTIASKRVAIEI